MAFIVWIGPSRVADFLRTYRTRRSLPLPAPPPPRGHEATDMLAHAILEAARVPRVGHGRYERGHDIWMVQGVPRATPSAQSGIRWHILRKWLLSGEFPP